MIEWIGSKYGGWNIDLSLVPMGSTVISAGLGNDISFDEELIKRRQCNIIGIDHTGLTLETINKKKLKNFTLIRKLLFVGDVAKAMNHRTNGATIYSGNANTVINVVDLRDILKEYKNISVVKMNIEGAEYPVITSIDTITVPQILVRFHHRKPDVPFTFDNTIICITKLKGLGYTAKGMSNQQDKKIDYEVLFTYGK